MNGRGVEQLLLELKARDIHLRLIDNQLRVSTPEEGMPAELRDELRACKQEILDILKATQADEDGSIPELIPSNDVSSAPLSFGQQRSWFVHELSKEQASPYDTLTLNLRMRGELNVDALERSLTEILRRHEVLRTVFILKDDEPRQMVEATSLDFEQEDISQLLPAERECRLGEMLQAAKNTLFDLAKGPLFKTRLIRLGKTEHVLNVIVHHIAFDDWSGGILMRELKLLYENFAQGRPSPLPELPLQYRDFSIWQRNWLQGEELQKHLGYWTDGLTDLPILDLPTDHPRPALQTFNGASEKLLLSRELSAALQTLSKQHGVTLHMTMLTVLGILLHRYSGQDDFGIGTPIASRDRNEVKDLIGFFLNMLVMRLDLSGEPTFTGMLEKVKHTALAGYAHQHLPFEKLVNEMELDRETNRTPLFQITFTRLDSQDSGLMRIDNLEISPISAVRQTTRFDLEVYVREVSAGLDLSIVYNTDLFDEATIGRMLSHYRALSQAMVASPGMRIADAFMLSEDERRQILSDWNQTVTDYPRDQPVHALFEQRVSAIPHSIAVEYEGKALSYAQLNTRANQVAHYLQARGVGPDVMVGICVERSLDMVVGLLGILKAGAAYVPLDTDYPESRIAYMLEDARVPVLLSQSSLSDGFPDFTGELVCLDSDWEKIAEESADNPVRSVTAYNLAYVMYTSGSTGIPKGVEIRHRAINRLVCNTDYYQVEASDRIAQASNVSFDAATFEIWGALLNGARLVGIDKEVLLDSKSLAAFLRKQGISAMFLTTALFNQIAREVPGAFTGLRGLMFGGEAVDPGAVRQVLASSSPARLIHVYGPTESTTFASWYQVEAVPDDATTVPIGQPLANTTLYILDRSKNPVPVGVPGELYIGGDGLARGYLNQPELMAESFIADPFSDDPSARLYRTGDNVRYRSDGAIEFLGRFDHQVKLRGFRIELGEIETALIHHEAVRDAVAVLREDEPGDKHLVAYVVAEDTAIPVEAELRTFVRERLPNYMVPSAFMMLDKLPLTANGKVDRKALPVPSEIQAGPGAEYKAPRTELERQLAGIWAEVLRLERIGIQDNFFDLGGHSLKMTQVVSRIRGQLNVELPLSEMFDHPTVAELASVVESLLDESDQEAVDVIPVVSRDADLPLSFAQERLWFLDQLDPGSMAYNIPLAIRLKGKLDVTALVDSLDSIVRRQEALRTRFGMGQGRPIQIIEAGSSELMQNDLSALPSVTLEDEIRARVDEEALQPFDLNTGPLLRGKLLRLSEHEHVLLLTLHHIVSDGWSLGVLFRELGACYEAFSQGEQPALAELPIQYPDFAVWQRGWLSGERLEAQLTYWQQKLADLETLNLPTDRPRPAVQTYGGAVEKLVLDAGLSEQLERLGKQAGVTPFMTLLGGFAVLMHRYSGQDDVVIGSPIANRNRKEIEDLIGFFINMLVLRLDLSGNPGFRALLEQVQETALGAYQHQEISFEKLVEVLQPKRDRSRNPLFQVQFALQDAPIEPLTLAGLVLEKVDQDARSTRFDLECHVWPRGAEQVVVFVYNTDLFDGGTIQGMLKHYRNLLQSLVMEPEQSIDLVSMLDADEKQLLLEQWNQGAFDYGSTMALPGLFERQAARNPAAMAVEMDGVSLSYAELDARSNQLARYLQARGVGPEVLVGLYLQRSLELVVGILGILKSGGAYVPMDPDYPRERLAFMLADCAAPVLLIQESLRQGLPDYAGQVVSLDADWPEIEKLESDGISTEIGAENLAYVIYTSGSTGQPKGVMVTHGNVTRLFTATAQWYGFDDQDVWTLFHSSAFDFSVWEIWGALLHGGRLVVVPYAVSRSPELFHKLLEETGVTVLNQTPSAFKQLTKAGEGQATQSLGNLRLVIFGGEGLDLQSIGPWFEKHGDQQPRLVNMYGITETTVHVTYRPLTASVVERGVSVIGHAIPDLQIYILDQYLQPVPVGVPGEMYIGGAGLARGYLNRGELTAERFIAHPFSDRPGDRLYRSGDLARYLADGDIEYLGRSDDQVKLRGFRIELGEIEAVLCQHPSVGEALVLCRDDEPQGQRLVAYVTTAGSEAPDIAELRALVRQRLPEYMLPSAFLVLERFPMTANGKLDRRALPMPEGERQSAETYVGPRSDMERQLATIWCEVLGLTQVGIHDNFFDLGGHSLMATQVVSRIRGQLNTELPLSEMFGYPTLTELAPVLESLLQESNGEEAEAIPVAGRGDNLPLSFAQERLWFLDQLEPGGSAYNMALALRLKGELSVAALENSLDLIIDRQQGLRTHFSLHQGKPSQVIEDITIVLKQDDLSALAPEMLEAEVNARIDAEALQPFDLNAGPLLRCSLLRLSDCEHVLLLTMHHVISDGWSLGVLFRELGVCYEAFSQGEQPALAELPIQYADFAVWQREFLSGEVLASQMDYWREQLQDLSTLNLPTDRSRPALQTYTGFSMEMALDAGLSKQLKSLSRKAGVTLFMTMLSGFAVLMHRYSGQEDIVLGTPIANRNRSELEDLVGFFVNSLVMRTDVSGNPGFRELVQRVNRTALDAFEHQDLPFEKLVDEIQPARDLSHNPLFQVMFALQNAPIESLDLKDLTLEWISREVRVSGFDLECHVWERGDRLKVIFMYNTDLFDASTIRRMMTHYRRLLEAATASPETPVSQLEILDDEEKQLMLHQWNQTRADFIKNETLHSLFQQQVNRTPQAIAVKFEQHSLCYSELEQKANDIAFLLLAKNVEPGQHVGVYLERSIDLVVAVLGILKAGAVYVPLDPEYPEDRLDYIVSDSDIRVLLSQERFENRLPPEITDVIYLDRDRLYDKVEAQTLPVVTEDALAYIIYTSGSTGKPKGVMVSHAAVVNHAFWTQDLFKLDQTDRILQKSPISFDASVGDIFVPLLNGACIVLAVPAGDKDINYLIEEIQNNKITTLILVPSALRVLLQNITDPAALGTLKRMGCGGEALPPDLIKAYYEKCSAPLYNLYGPTESTIDATSFLCGKDFNRDNIPIGYPISNKQAYILDQQMQPVPIGVHGELHLGGAGLARGYLNQPELTAEKFVADPFSEDPAARLYKTGDLARYRADGSIEYIGRIDQQVKVRGFRIELGEIETVLSQHDSIESCAVLIYEDLQGYKNIAAFFVSDSSFSTLSLRNFLRRKLPHFMIPSLFTKLDEIPVTPNGKTDYKTLASYAEGKTVRDGIYLRPETAEEKKIAGIWEALLNVDRVGAGDSFFDIGGHSLLLIQARSVIEKELGVSVPIVDFFHQTLGQIANYCEKNQSPEMSTEET